MPVRLFLILTVALFSVSTTALVIKHLSTVSPFVMAFWRMFLASVLLGGYSVLTPRENINRKNIISVICYGHVGPTLHSMLKKIKPTSYYKLFEDAVKNSIKIAKNDDVVLLSPAFKSYDQFKNFEERGNKFKEIVKEYYA